jgi:hypothetical protein
MSRKYWATDNTDADRFAAAKDATARNSKKWGDGVTCQVCGRAGLEVNTGKIPHHGFTRPGDGYIHGECFGGNRLPYQVAKEGLIELQPLLVEQQANLIQQIAITTADECEISAVLLTDAPRHLRRTVSVNKETFDAVKAANPDLDWTHSSYETVKSHRLRGLKQALNETRDSIAYVGNRIANWTQVLEPLAYERKMTVATTKLTNPVTWTATFPDGRVATYGQTKAQKRYVSRVVFDIDVDALAKANKVASYPKNKPPEQHPLHGKLEWIVFSSTEKAAQRELRNSLNQAHRRYWEGWKKLLGLNSFDVLVTEIVEAEAA